MNAIGPYFGLVLGAMVLFAVTPELRTVEYTPLQPFYNDGSQVAGKPPLNPKEA